MTSKRITTLLLVVALGASACGTTDEPTLIESEQTATSSLDEGEEPAVGSGQTLATEATQPGDDVGSYDPAVLEQARAEFDEARARWDSAGVTDYELVVSLPGLIERRTTVVDGVGVASEVADNSGGNFELPQTVEEIFDEADALIAAAEDDPMVDFNQCIGHFFNVGYDEEFGYPSLWDSFSPCEDGVAYMAEVIVG